MVPPVANVHGNPAKLGLEHGVAQVSLHVVSGLKRTKSSTLVPQRGNSSAFLSLSQSEYHQSKINIGV